MTERVITYAQNREDVVLSAFFLQKRDGFYVDVGANDPAVHSVTKYFYDLGWKGINIEPSPKLYKKLVKERPNDINLNIGVSNKKGSLTFREYDGHGLSTFSKETMAELSEQGHPLTQKYKDYKVNVDSLQSIFSKLILGADSIDFLKVDVEGYEYEVIEGNDWGKYRPKVICIEANHIQKDWPSLLISNNYEKVFNDGLNDYYQDKLQDNVAFDYINGLIGREVVPVYAQAEIDLLAENNKQAQSSLKIKKNQNSELTREIVRLNAYIYDHSRLRVIIKDLIKKVDMIIKLRLSQQFRSAKSYPKLILQSSMTDPKEIIIALSAADKKAFLQRPTLAKVLKSMAAKSLYIGYRATTRTAGKLARLTIRIRRSRLS